MGVASPVERAESGAARRVGLPFALAFGALVVTYWSVDIVSPALPEIKDDLRISSASVGLIYSLLFLGRLLGNFSAGALLGRIGAALTGTFGALILLVGEIGAALAPGPFLLVPARVVQGIGISLLVNACLRAILSARPGRGVAMTYFGLGATAGSVIGLETGGFLTEHHGWRAVFAFGAVLAGAIACATFGARIGSSDSGEPVDARPAARTAERASIGPMLPPLIFNFLIFFNYSVFVALPLYTEHRFAASPETNARLLMVISVVHIAASLPAGRAIRRWGSQRALVAGMVLAIAGTLSVVSVPNALVLTLPLLLYGAGQIAGSNAAGDAVLHLGGQSTRAIGYLRFSSDLGLVVGPYATGTLSDHVGYGAPFVALSAVMALAAACALRPALRASVHPD